MRKHSTLLSLFLIVFIVIISIIEAAAQTKSEPQLEDLRPFHDNTAAAKLKGKWGIVDTTYHWIIAPQYDYAEAFAEDWALVGNFDRTRADTTHYYDSQLDENITDIQFPIRYQFIDKTGKKQLALYEYNTVRSFSGGVACVAQTVKRNNKLKKLYGFIDKKGKLILPLQYNWASDFGCGLAPFGGDKLGFINIKGDTIIAQRFLIASPFQDSLARVMLPNGYYNYIRPNGQPIFAQDIWEASNFTEQRAFIKKDRKTKWHQIIDAQGRVVNTVFFQFHSQFSEGFCAVWNEADKFNTELPIGTYIDLAGNKPFEGVFEKVGDFKQGKALVKQEETSFYITRDGTAIEPQAAARPR